MNTWFKKSFVLSAGLALILAGCGAKTDHAATNTSQTESNPAQTADSGKKLNVVTTFYPMYEFTKQVAGDHANVTALIPAGAEPHDWEPSAKDMAQVKDADVFVYNGIVEGWAEQALSSASNDKRVVVEASKGLNLMEGSAEEEEGEEAHAEEGHDHDHVLDPHVWLDPVLAQKEVEAIEAGLVKADPTNKADYEKNADAYIAKLKELDTEFKTGLKNVKRKDFITQHAAFSYLAKQYGLTQVPIAGLSPEQEPTPDKLAGIIKFAKDNNVKTIFFETLVDPKVAETVATEIGSKTDVLNPLEGLTDEDKQKNLDYLGVMKNNLEALKKALNE
ncbi:MULTISPECIES: metal ABC transporter substrate-binding protein [Paenibacillus]|uniref:metal ABC transporter substrate-binding protein n=1 Tax=Paenibacillus TaxID=44249 RepID=UPI000D2FF3D2|nr:MULTISPECIES: metal ABC transporter substrate-binding protein [Paenibacillus]KAF6614256.1 zinc ABC transporter substrate-binding protein [Paenibacillus sp. EKM101P]KAF6616619.1 zinc ABC transporter substrate-binding protein [Paenibacillus sp. EKM102P]KAF6625076.1 zinc ABC transporter substrate-binding protein [Paenibacillus sp. EKM10P]KAF6640926.1 zinc ABC transporter substrate-binding protein [Paenibacillus sp. EKM11P]PTU44211.1 zinc ABC transporter substrate-binding protein [Paenibacillus